VERRHDASGDVATGVYAAAGGAGAKTKAPSDSLWWLGVLAPDAKLRAKVVPRPREEPAQGAPLPEDTKAAQGRPMRLGWAKLLKRVFNLDLEHCPNCGGELKVIAAILERPAIEKILTHVGLDARPPPRSPARGQMPLQDF
jgi:hypothetical protein